MDRLPNDNGQPECYKSLHLGWKLLNNTSGQPIPPTIYFIFMTNLTQTLLYDVISGMLLMMEPVVCTPQSYVSQVQRSTVPTTH